MAWMLIGTFWMFSERFSAVTTISLRAVALPAAAAAAARAGCAARQVDAMRMATPTGAAPVRFEKIEFVIIHPWAFGPRYTAKTRALAAQRQAGDHPKSVITRGLWPICPRPFPALSVLRGRRT